MIFMVVKWRPKAEYVENSPSSRRVLRGRPKRAKRTLRVVTGVDDPSEYVLAEGSRRRCRKEHVTSEHFKKFVAGAPLRCQRLADHQPRDRRRRVGRDGRNLGRLERSAVGNRRIPPAVGQAVLHRGTGRTAHVGYRIPPFGAWGTVRVADSRRDHRHECQRSSRSCGSHCDTSKDLLHALSLSERLAFQTRHHLLTASKKVRAVGLEPTCSFEHGHLKPARKPISPRPQRARSYLETRSPNLSVVVHSARSCGRLRSSNVHNSSSKQG